MRSTPAQPGPGAADDYGARDGNAGEDDGNGARIARGGAGNAEVNGARVARYGAGNGASRRAHLSEFLRIRREALGPQEVGLPGGGRRRTPGLRREEVAQLAGVGTTWYTWLEQGRDVRASRSVLEAIADALRMTPAERSHLIVLGRGEEFAAARAPREQVAPTLARLVRHLGASPACILGRRWDFLAWNDAYAVVFGDPTQLPPERRNLVWAMFTDPARRALFLDWADSARHLVARFRADSARHVADPDFEELIEELTQASVEFSRWWRRHEVVRSGMGRRRLRHPSMGEMAFEHGFFKLEETPEQRLALYTPLEQSDTAEKVRQLLERRS